MTMKPEISPNFTLDDIEKIREYAGERFMSMSEEAFRAEIRESAYRMQKKLDEVRKDRVVQKVPT